MNKKKMVITAEVEDDLVYIQYLAQAVSELLPGTVKVELDGEELKVPGKKAGKGSRFHL